MAGTRSSARLKASAAPKYNEEKDSEVEEAPARSNGNKATRRKRVRAEEEKDVAQDSPPAKKAKSKASKESKETTSKASKETTSKPSKATKETTSKETKETTSKAKAPAKAPKPAEVSEPTTTKPKSLPPPEPSSPSNCDANGNQEVYWLFKAEPLPRYENGINVAFSITDLRNCTEPEPWTGVRNPSARNNMRAMRKGDLGFFYHSNAKPSGIVGILRVVEEAKVDETAFDPKDPYYDAKSDWENPKWWCVGVEFVREFENVIDLARIKELAKEGGPLRDMQLVTQGRLSVCRVRREEWEFILGLADGGKKEGEEKEE